MTTIRANALNPALDISGTIDQESNANVNEESLRLGLPLFGQTGSSASITGFDGNLITIDGLSGMLNNSISRFITITGAGTPNNNGTFPIKEFVSTTSVRYENSFGVFPDANSGLIAWVERAPYSLQDDLNYIRTDRSNIKGVNYDQNIPTYQQADATNIAIPANLFNIADHALDARAFIIEKKLPAISITPLTSFTTVTSVGNLKHSQLNDLTGVPIFDDEPYFTDFKSCYVAIINPGGGQSLVNLSDINQVIFGLTRAGSSISPDSVEIEFRTVIRGADLSTSLPYVWELGQITTVDLFYGFSVRGDKLNPSDFRTLLTDFSIANSFNKDITRLILETNGSIVYVGDGDPVLKV